MKISSVSLHAYTKLLEMPLNKGKFDFSSLHGAYTKPTSSLHDAYTAVSCLPRSFYIGYLQVFSAYVVVEFSRELNAYIPKLQLWELVSALNSLENSRARLLDRTCMQGFSFVRHPYKNPILMLFLRILCRLDVGLV